MNRHERLARLARIARERWYLWPLPYLAAAALVLPLLGAAVRALDPSTTLAWALATSRAALSVGAVLAVAFALVLTPLVLLARRLRLGGETTAFLIGFLVLAFFVFDPFIGSDGIGYYAWLRSAAFDRDLWFGNEYTFLDPPFRHTFDAEFMSRRAPTGRLQNYWSVGPAMLWAPLVALAHGMVLVAGKLGSPVRADGFSFPYAYLATWGTALCGLVSMLVSLKLLRARSRLGEPAQRGVVLACFFGTPLFVYALRFPCFPHAIQSGVATLYLALFVLVKDKRSWAYAAASGALLGFSVVCYWQAALLLVFPLWEGVTQLGEAWRRRRLLAELPVAAGRGAVVGGVVVLFMLPQMLAWYVVYGSPLTVPQGAGFMDAAYNYWREVLLSSNNGLLWWSPLMLVGFVGLLAGRVRPVVVPGAAFLLLLYFHHTRMLDWYGGGGSGPRRFTVAFALFALGVAATVERLPRRWPAAVAGVLGSCWVVLLDIQVGGGAAALRSSSASLADKLAERLVLRHGQLHSFFLENPLYVLFRDGLSDGGRLAWGLSLLWVLALLALGAVLFSTRGLDRLIAALDRQGSKEGQGDGADGVPIPRAQRAGASTGLSPWGGCDWAVIGALTPLLGVLAAAVALRSPLPSAVLGMWPGGRALWDPTVGSGVPARVSGAPWADPLVALATHVLPVPWVLVATTVVFAVVGLCGSYILVREMGAGRWAGALAGVAYSGSTLIGAGQGTLGAWAALPWVLLGFEAALRRRELRWAVLGGIALAAMAASALPVGCLYGAVTLGLYALAVAVGEWVAETSWRGAGQVMAAGATVAAVGFALGSPFLVSAHRSFRQAVAISEAAAPGAPFELARVPLAGLLPATGQVDLAVGPGMVVLLCAAGSLFAAQRWRGVPMAVLGGLVLVAPSGPPLLAALTGRLFPASAATAPRASSLVAAFCCCVAAGLGVEGLARTRALARRRWLVPALVVLAVGELSARAWLAPEGRRWRNLLAEERSTAAPGEDIGQALPGRILEVSRGAGQVVGSLELWGLTAAPGHSSWRLGREVSYLSAAREAMARDQAAGFELRDHPLLDALDVRYLLVGAGGLQAPGGSLDLVQLLAEARAESIVPGGVAAGTAPTGGAQRPVIRVTGPTRVELGLRVPIGGWLRSAVGLCPAGSAGSDGMSFQVRVVSPRTGATTVLFDTLVHPGGGPRQGETVPVDLDLSAFGGQEVTLVLATGPGLADDAAGDVGLWIQPLVTASASTSLEAMRVDKIRVFRNRDPMPRSWLVNRVIEVGPGDLQTARRCLVAPTFEPAGEVVVEGRVPGRLGPASPGDCVRLESYSMDRVEIHVQARRAGWLVLADGFAAGWRAEVDGSAAAILPTNVVMRGLYVTAGEHRVVLEYREADVGGERLAVGLAVAIGSWVLVWPTFRRRWQRGLKGGGTGPVL